ncbi:heart- and neural crest derivatives-expressed protein 2-like [Patiria miniata]|uniref:BHLH domain-containing protein n=1 Tax=Patiria miniata TaxID=46514 RepID=A0A913ZVG8_PATMI|nr:heart- and neural crest derivatives-expressed protein 2-like [Patiria miniata]
MLDTMSMLSEYPPVPVSLQRPQDEHLYRHHNGHGRCPSIPEHDKGYYHGLLLSPAVAATGEMPHEYGSPIHHQSFSPCSQTFQDQITTAVNNNCGSPNIDCQSAPLNSCDERSSPPGPRRFGKRRCPTNSNRKERRRTLSINSAFADLRECIPNVPADTKLSKIKTLRLATSYIAYLSEVLAKDDGIGPVDTASFKAELLKIEDRERRKKAVDREMTETAHVVETRRSRGRTGWPQHVWALELQR